MHIPTPTNKQAGSARAWRWERLAALLAAAVFAICLGMTVQACGDDLVVGGEIVATIPVPTATEDPDA